MKVIVRDMKFLCGSKAVSGAHLILFMLNAMLGVRQRNMSADLGAYRAQGEGTRTKPSLSQVQFVCHHTRDPHTLITGAKT